MNYAKLPPPEFLEESARVGQDATVDEIEIVAPNLWMVLFEIPAEAVFAMSVEILHVDND